MASCGDWKRATRDPLRRGEKGSGAGATDDGGSGHRRVPMAGRRAEAAGDARWKAEARVGRVWRVDTDPAMGYISLMAQSGGKKAEGADGDNA